MNRARRKPAAGMAQANLERLLEDATDLAMRLRRLSGRYPSDLDDLEAAAATINLLILEAAGVQRVLLASIVNRADARALRERLEAEHGGPGSPGSGVRHSGPPD